MATPDSQRIARELLGEPHIRDRRISVRQVYALVEDHGEDVEAVADRYDLDVAGRCLPRARVLPRSSSRTASG